MTNYTDSSIPIGVNHMYLEDNTRTDILIWWTDQIACEVIGDRLSDTVPDYIRREYRSRLGRAGRGRLWVDNRFGDVGIPWDTSKPAARLSESRGGIVIARDDAPHVFGLPGYLTDCKLNILNTLEDALLSVDGEAQA